MPFQKKILIISDFDGTFYNKEVHQDQIYLAKEREFELIARHNTLLGNNTEEVRNNVLTISQRSGISSSQVILTALTLEQWLTVRLVTTWYSQLKLDIKSKLISLPSNCKFIIASHTPKKLIEFAFSLPKAALTIYGPKDLGSYKPDLKFFRTIAKIEDVKPGQCIYIGDKPAYDILPAKQAGYMEAIPTQGNAAKIIKQLGCLAKKENSFRSFKSSVSSRPWENQDLCQDDEDNNISSQLQFQLEI